MHIDPEKLEAFGEDFAAELNKQEELSRQTESNADGKVAARLTLMHGAFVSCVRAVEPVPPAFRARVLRATAELLGVRL